MRDKETYFLNWSCSSSIIWNAKQKKAIKTVVRVRDLRYEWDANHNSGTRPSLCKLWSEILEPCHPARSRGAGLGPHCCSRSGSDSPPYRPNLSNPTPEFPLEIEPKPPKMIIKLLVVKWCCAHVDQRENGDGDLAGTTPTAPWYNPRLLGWN